MLLVSFGAVAMLLRRAQHVHQLLRSFADRQLD